VIFAVIDNSFSKLRLFKITEFMAVAFLLAVLAVLVLFLEPGKWPRSGRRHRR